MKISKKSFAKGLRGAYNPIEFGTSKKKRVKRYIARQSAADARRLEALKSQGEKSGIEIAREISGLPKEKFQLEHLQDVEALSGPILETPEPVVLPEGVKEPTVDDSEHGLNMREIPTPPAPASEDAFYGRSGS